MMQMELFTTDNLTPATILTLEAAEELHQILNSVVTKAETARRGNFPFGPQEQVDKLQNHISQLRFELNWHYNQLKNLLKQKRNIYA